MRREESGGVAPLGLREEGGARRRQVLAARTQDTVGGYVVERSGTKHPGAPYAVDRKKTSMSNIELPY